MPLKPKTVNFKKLQDGQHRHLRLRYRQKKFPRGIRDPTRHRHFELLLVGSGQNAQVCDSLNSFELLLLHGLVANIDLEKSSPSKPASAATTVRTITSPANHGRIAYTLLIFDDAQLEVISGSSFA